MVKVSVFYPNSAGCKFDMNYYLTKHMPMVQQKLGAACKSIAVEQGIAAARPARLRPMFPWGISILIRLTPFRPRSVRTRRRSSLTFPTTPTRSRPFRSAT